VAVLVISYSRDDQALVRGLVKFLRAALRGIDRTVFWDDDFEPGEEWFAQIAAAIDDAQTLFVAWCSHSAISQQVAREIDYAFEHSCRVVPVLLDNTPLSSRLAPIQGIDLRQTVVHDVHGINPSYPYSGPSDPDMGKMNLRKLINEMLSDDTRIAPLFAEHLDGVSLVGTDLKWSAFPPKFGPDL
jgi:hypothetical protein